MLTEADKERIKERRRVRESIQRLEVTPEFRERRVSQAIDRLRDKTRLGSDGEWTVCPAYEKGEEDIAYYKLGRGFLKRTTLESLRALYTFLESLKRPFHTERTYQAEFTSGARRIKNLFTSSNKVIEVRGLSGE